MFSFKDAGGTALALLVTICRHRRRVNFNDVWNDVTRNKKTMPEILECRNNTI